MRRLILFLSLTAAALCSCSLEDAGQQMLEEVVFMNAADSLLLTRTFTPTTSGTLMSDGFYAGVLTPGGVYQPVSHVSFSLTTGLYSFDCGHVWYPQSAVPSFFAAYPVAPVFAGGDVTVPVSWDPEGDLVVACTESASRPTVLAFEHVLSRLTVHCTAADPDAVCRVTRVSVLAGVAGVYDFDDRTLTVTQVMTAPDVCMSGVAELENAAQRVTQERTYLPGNVTVEIAWEYISSGSVSARYVRHAVIPLLLGRRCSYTFVLPNDESLPVRFSVQVLPWENITNTPIWR